MTNTTIQPHEYVGLHTHTDSSILDGFTTVKDLVKRVKELGQTAVVSTDHGNLHNSYALYAEAKANGIKPLVGIEAYVAPSPISHKSHEAYFFSKDEGQRRDDVSSRGSYTHLLLFAKNNEGLKALYKMSELSYTEGFFRKPRMSVEMFEQYANGNLIATTGCPSGELQTLLRLSINHGRDTEQGRKLYEQAVAYAARMQKIFGKENYFMELMNHDMSIDLERKVEEDLLHIAKQLDIPLLATADSHYTYPTDANAHEHLLCISTHSKMNVPTSREEGEGGKTRFAFDGEGYYVHSAEEMLRKFPEDKYPGAVRNSAKIAAMCNVVIEPRDDLRPKIDLPEGETEASWIRKEAFEGLARRLPNKATEQAYIDRLEVELGVIVPKNYSGYFLVVSDFLRWAKANEVPCGPGRGCLTENSRVLTDKGFKSINKISIGDRVYNMYGNLETVTNTFEYDINEELLEIKAYYGGQGNVMTKDHKVLVSKANRTGKTKLKEIKYTKELSEPQWIPASEIELGDLVVMPKINYPVTITSFEINPEHGAATNVKYEHNVRAIAENVGVHRSSVMKFFKNNGEVTGKNSVLIQNYMLKHGLTVESEKARRKTVNTLPVTNLEANHDLGWLLGVFLSDGWTRKNRAASVGFAQRLSEDNQQIPDMFYKIFGVELTGRVSKTSDLIQYGIEHKGIGDFFHSLFPEYEQTAHTKYIPKELLQTSEQFRKGLLEGLWYGDGTHKGKSKYSTVSSRLADGVVELLLSLGLPAGIKISTRTETRPGWNKTGATRTEYNIVTAHNFNLDVITNNVGIKYDGEYSYYRVREINSVQNINKVYDFTMPETNSYVTDSYVVHNSAAGSLLAYCLDITDADPIRFGLLFERFLNPERESPPDIDIDLNDTDRERVIEYVKNKYGEERVAQVVTFGKILAKNAVKDTVRILDLPYSLGDQLTKAMPEPVFGKTMPLKDMYDPASARYDEAGDFRALVKQEQAGGVIDIARQLEGRIRSTGVHAAAVVVSGAPVVENIPMMMRQADGAMITQWDYPTAEHLGLLKFDFLGLRNLGVIRDAVKHVKNNRGIDIDVTETIEGSLDDPKVYELLGRGNTLGVFQLDGGGLQSLLKLMKPTEFEDISAVLSLYRPGPMGVQAHTDYALRKNGLQKVDYIHPDLTKVLTPILGPTFGLVIYQEQVQLIAREMAGYSLGQADNLRRAMGKKKREVLEAEFIPFSEGCYSRGYSKESVKAIWDVLVPFADYAFNKSHTVAYGLISYMTAFLKANYPAEFYAALLTSVSDDSDKTAAYLEDARVNGIRVLPPDVSRSEVDYVPLNETEVLFGLKAVRGIGANVGVEIAEERRKNGPYKDFNDLIKRSSGTVVNKRVLEGLSYGGAFDGLGVSRRALIYQIPELVKQFQKIQRSKSKQSQQMSLFDFEDSVEYVVLPMDEYPRMEKLSLERNALGLYVSGHPIDGLNISNMASVKIGSLLDGSVPALEGWPGRGAVPQKIAGVLTSLVVKRTKKGEKFGIARLEDRSGSIECPIFPRAFVQVEDLLKVDGVYQFTGFARVRDETVNFPVDSARPLEFSESGNLSVRLKVTEPQWLSAKDEVLEVLKRFPPPLGEPGDNVIISIKNVANEIYEEVLDVRVQRSPALIQRMHGLLGSLCVGRWRAVKTLPVDGEGGEFVENGDAVAAPVAEVKPVVVEQKKTGNSGLDALSLIPDD